MDSGGTMYAISTQRIKGVEAKQRLREDQFSGSSDNKVKEKRGSTSKRKKRTGYEAGHNNNDDDLHRLIERTG